MRDSSRFALLFLATLCVAPACPAEDWPQFLGMHRDGTSPETGLISEWPAAGPKVIWRTPLGVGMSGVIASEGRAFTLFQDEEKVFLVSLNVSDGREIWRTPFAAAYENAMGNGARATPTVANGRVFAFTGEGILAAFDTMSGKELWHVDVPTMLKGTPSEYGMSCSPLVFDKSVIIHTGNQEAAVAAFDEQSGKLKWAAATGKAGYSSPVLLELSKQDQVVTLTADGAFGLNLADGTVLWSYAFPPNMTAIPHASCEWMNRVF